MELKGIQNCFKGNIWKEEINVRDFIQTNYKEYCGDTFKNFWDFMTEEEQVWLKQYTGIL